MSPFFLALLVAAALLVLAAEWPRLRSLAGSRPKRAGEEDDFASSVRRDLDSLPTVSDDELRKML